MFKVLKIMIKNTYDFKDVVDIIDAIGSNNYNFDCPEAMDKWLDYGFVKKDILNGQELKVKELTGCNGETFDLLCENLIVIPCYIKKEKKFFEMSGLEYDTPTLIQWLKTQEAKDWFKDQNIVLSTIIDGKLTYGSLIQSLLDNKKQEFFKEIKNPTNVYLAKVIGKNDGGFMVDVSGLQSFLPGSLASANKIIDFDNYIDKKIHVMIEDYIREGDVFIVSNKKYIQYILPKKMAELDFIKKQTGIITGLSNFGIFIEFNEIFTGLLHTSEMSEETKSAFNRKDIKYSAGQEIEFYIKEIGKNNRIILTEKLRSEKIPTLGDFKVACEQTFQNGDIVNVKPIGSFIKFKYNDEFFIGLLHYREYPNSFTPEVGKNLMLWITKVDVETNKIFLKWDAPDDSVGIDKKYIP